MLATSLSQDLYKRFVNPAAIDRQVRDASRAARRSPARVAAVAVAMLSKSVVDALGFFYTLVGVSLFVPIVAGLYLRRPRALDALAAIAGGIVAAVAVQFGDRGQGDRPVHAGDVRAGGSRGRRLRLVSIALFSAESRVTQRVVRSDGEDRGGDRRGLGHRRGDRARLRGAGRAGRLSRRERRGRAARRGEGTAGGGLCEAGAIDICDGAGVERVFTELDAKYGVDIVICTPAINVRKPILKYTDEELSRVLDVNIKGNFNVLRAAGRVMTERRRRAASSSSRRSARSRSSPARRSTPRPRPASSSSRRPRRPSSGRTACA